MTLKLRPSVGVALVVAVLLTVTATAAAQPGPAHAVDARVAASFVMHGRIVAALRVRGERRGRRITRTWAFTGQACAGNVCRRLLLRRERTDRHYSSLVLRRVGRGRYAGTGMFYAGLESKGKLYPQGEVVPYRITLTVTQIVAIQGIRFARGVDATYLNSDPVRSHPVPDSGRATTRPPTAARHRRCRRRRWRPCRSSSPRRRTGPSSPTPLRPAPAVHQIVFRRWVFGNPASAGADVSAGVQVSHTFTAPVLSRVAHGDGCQRAFVHHKSIGDCPGTPAGGVHRDPARRVARVHRR